MHNKSMRPKRKRVINGMELKGLPRTLIEKIAFYSYMKLDERIDNVIRLLQYKGGSGV